MAVEAVDHLNIVVSDMGRSVAFYTGVLGLRETKRAWLEGAWIESVAGLPGVRAEVVFVEPGGGGPRVELIQYHAPLGAEIGVNSAANTLGLRHMAFRVGDIFGEYARMRGLGVEFLGPPVLVPQGVVRHDGGEKHLCYFYDPDGVLLELASYSGNSG